MTVFKLPYSGQMSGRIVVDNARLYADAENRQAVRHLYQVS